MKSTTGGGEFSLYNVSALRNGITDRPGVQAEIQAAESARKTKERAQVLARRRQLALIVAAAYGLIVVVSFGQQFFQMQKIDRDIEQVQTQINAMQQRNQELKVEVKRLKTDAYVERIAREKLGLVKQGETVLLPATVSEQALARGNSSGGVH